MSNSQFITGAIMIILGLFICLIPIFNQGTTGLIALIYGIPILVIGIIIILNKTEDKIEEIKHERRSNKKWRP